MGFGTLVTHIILFISVITVSAGFLLVTNQYVQETTSGISAQREQVVSEIRTDISITGVNYDNTTNPDTITIYATNTGKTQLRPNRTDLYVDDVRISRTNRDVIIQTDTEVNNPNIWDPSEVLEITTQQDIDEGLHSVAIVAENGVREEDTFST